MKEEEIRALQIPCLAGNAAGSLTVSAPIQFVAATRTLSVFMGRYETSTLLQCVSQRTPV